MAASLITPQQLVTGGITITFEACNVGGNFFLNSNGRYYIIVKNTGAQLTIHVASPIACSQGYTHPLDIVVPATTGNISSGVFETGRFNDTNNYVQLTYPGGITGLTIAVIKF